MTTISPRIDVPALAGAPYAAMVRLEERVRLEPAIKHLVKLRASTINGCAFCLDMHWSAAREDGEPELRLAQIAGWRESPAFTERERAVLALTDAMTLIAGHGAPDDVWAEAERHFDPAELAHLVCEIAAINFWNRVAVTARTTPATFATMSA